MNTSHNLCWVEIEMADGEIEFVGPIEGLYALDVGNVGLVTGGLHWSQGPSVLEAKGSDWYHKGRKVRCWRISANEPGPE